MKNPIQPLAKDERGVLRFKANAIVRHLLDTHPDCDLNRLACMDFTDDDRQQFAQLIGYSLSGYGELRRSMQGANRGGPGRGQGRKPVKQGEETVTLSLRVTVAQREKLARLGGAEWVRGKIDRAKEPNA